MKSILRKLTLCALLGASTSAYAAVELIPNGDFEDADNSLTWERVDGSGPGAPVTFGTGGNPGGYGEVTPNGGWGILVSRPTGGTNAQGFVPIASLGLTAGDTATFTYDSINLSGPRRAGGFKWEAFDADGNLVGDTGDTWRDPVIGDGTTWETYTYDWVLPATTENLIFVPLWAGGANTDTVGFDNIGVVPEPSSAMLIGLFGLGFLARRTRRS